MAQALVPLKDLVQAKSRLSGLLCPSERSALAKAMAEDVLSVLAGHSAIQQITLVSDDPGAALLARKYGAQCWSERSLGARGLNALMQSASARLLADSEEHPLLVMHGDLPLLTADDISAVLASQGKLQGLIIGCDRRRRGTNLLAFSAACVPRFCFGADSCDGHSASARGAGIAVQILQRLGISVDVDEAPDLKFVMERMHLNPIGNTAQLLYTTELGARVSLALAAMLGDGPPLHAALIDDTDTGIAN